MTFTGLSELAAQPSDLWTGGQGGGLCTGRELNPEGTRGGRVMSYILRRIRGERCGITHYNGAERCDMTTDSRSRSLQHGLMYVGGGGSN